MITLASYASFLHEVGLVCLILILEPNLRLWGAKAVLVLTLYNGSLARAYDEFLATFLFASKMPQVEVVWLNKISTRLIEGTHKTGQW